METCYLPTKSDDTSTLKIIMALFLHMAAYLGVKYPNYHNDDQSNQLTLIEETQNILKVID